MDLPQRESKPSFLPHTAIMLISATLIGEICRGLRSPAEVEPWRIGRRLAAVLAGAILVSGFYFILTWHAELDYFLSNSGGGKDAAIWKVKGGLWASLAGRVQGYSMDLTLGHFKKLLAGWLFFGLGFSLFQRNHRATLFIVGGATLALISLLLISAGQMVDPHFSYTLTAIQNADFVEIADTGAQWLDRWLPSASLQRALLERVRSLAGFEELAPVVGKEGTVFLFKRRI
jgi:hypothetical protein